MIVPSGPALRIEVHATLDSIDAAAWNRFAGDQLFMRHESWADAHQHSGLPCSPELPHAVPFAPVSGVRWISGSDAERELLVAGALDFHCDDRAYGRCWGGTEWHSGLYFETCYYQSIEHSIAHGATVFEGGTVGDFPVRETRGITHCYVNELNEHAPFRSNRAPGDGAG